MRDASPPGGIPPHLHLRDLPGGPYEPGELGASLDQTPAHLLDALRVPRRGEVYDLDCGRWAGMPVFPVHPPFILTSYRTPRGVRVQQDIDLFRNEVNAVGMGLNTELIVGTTHTGTHIDALSHITCGLDAHWHGGYTESAELTDFGPARAEASSIGPFLRRGVLIDLAAARGVDVLPGRSVVDTAELASTLEAQGTEVRPGDAVLLRTGYMQVWGTEDAHAHHGAGIDHGAAAWLADHGVCLVGADTEGVEVVPSVDPENPHPVHIELLVRRGIHILELAWLEDLARDRVLEFLFVCLPLRIRGATGSMVRPVAIA
mgnify:CR=1 FL=1